jgi:hypothetical protein
MVKIVNGEIVLQESSVIVNGDTKAKEEFLVVEEEAQQFVCQSPCRPTRTIGW